MTPWEIRSHIAFLQGEAVPHPKFPAVLDVLATFVREWQALWACYGEQRDGWPRYRALLDATKPEIAARGGNEIFLRNGVRVMEALDAWVFIAALADRRDSADPEVRHASAAHGRRDAESRGAGCSGTCRHSRNRRSGVRPSGVHRVAAAHRFDVSVRNAGAVAVGVHDRRREPSVDRRCTGACARGERIRVEPAAG